MKIKMTSTLLILAAFILNACSHSRIIDQKNWYLSEFSKKYELKSVSKPKLYVGDDLFKYNNGGAVIYIDTGFKRLLVKKFKSKTKKRFNLEIFEMDSIESAKKIFTIIAGKKYQKNIIGQGHIFDDHYCMFWQGKYYVVISISSVRVSDFDKEIILELAKTVVKKLI